MTYNARAIWGIGHASSEQVNYKINALLENNYENGELWGGLNGYNVIIITALYSMGMYR